MPRRDSRGCPDDNGCRRRRPPRGGTAPSPWCALALAALLAGPGAAPPAAAQNGDPRAPCPLELRDVAEDAGIDFRHATGAAGEKHLPETMGAGVAWIDVDGDGWLDLYLVQSGPFPPDGSEAAANRLYRNLGGRGAVAFAPWPDAGAGDRGYGQGALAGDLDGDGDLDLVVTRYGGEVVLLINDGAGRFAARPLAAGPTAEPASPPPWSSSAALGDTDGDGDLDLYVARYLEYDPGHGLFCGDPPTDDAPARRDYCDPSLFAGSPDRLYLNRGDGTWVDATESAGLGGADGRGLGVVFTDLDGDGRADLYVANDLTLNLLFRNLGPGEDGGPRFEDVSLLSGTAVNRDGKPEAGMGVIAADLDGDGDPELAVTNFDVETNTLYRNDGELFFEDISAESGFGIPSFNRLGFGLVAGDFDLDGALDLYVANGHIFERPRRDNVAYRQPDQLLLGDGAGGLRELECATAALRAAVGRGAASADFDNDGDLDLVVSNSDDRPFLLENRLEESRGSASFLSVELVGRPPNTQAVGARVTLTTGSAAPQVRWVQAGDSYLSSSDRRLLFAWRSPQEPARLDVTWPSGARRRVVLEAAAAGRFVRLVEGAAR
ncbi:MAG TPA: CRTAC1 family protein [Thermoanaerobaculia bacterium]|nr:CRTAC1 family protein [Thermoanaerobaculia bacterium]